MPFKSVPEGYATWQSMKQRCLNKSNPSYIRYGARGITVCPEWVASFDRFILDVGPKPTPSHTLDRVDNDGPYCKENCRWATRYEQSINRGCNILVQIGDTPELACEVAKSIGVKTDTVAARFARGCSKEDIFSKERLTYTEGLALGGAANGRRQRAKSHCPKGHEYLGANLALTKEGFRVCKRCRADKEARRRAKKKLMTQSSTGVRLEP